MDNNPNDFGTFINMIGLAGILIAIFFWLFVAFAALQVAPADRPWTFFWMTFLILGPLGLAAALVAQPRQVTPAQTVRREAAAGPAKRDTAGTRSQVTARARAHGNLAAQIDAKLADFDAGRISLDELESYLNGVESKQDPA